MPWQDVPGQSGTRWRPASETLADPDYEVIEMPDGTLQARKKPGWFIKALPWLIGGGMGYGALANAGVFGAGLAGGSGAGQAAATGAAGTLPSYGPTAGMIAAGSGLPSVGAISPAAAMGGAGIPGAIASGAGTAAQLSSGGGSSVLGKILTGLKNYGPLALAGTSALKGFTQGKTPAESQIEELLKLAHGRATASEPLFQALNTMTQAQLPKYARGEK